ncbi:glycosyltransferase family 4 protein [Aquimarina sp. M1]
MKNFNNDLVRSIFLETHNINNLCSGFGQFNFNLAKALSKEKDFLLEHEVILNCTNRVAKKELGSMLSYNKYRPFTRYSPFRIRKNFNLWHSVNQNTKIEPFSNKIPYLLTIHDVNFIDEYEGEQLDIRISQFKNKIERSHALVYISEFAKKSTREFFEIPDIPEYVIYNGNTYDNTISDLKEKEYKIVNDIPNKPFIFSIGKVVEKKNFLSLIEMLRFLPDINLVIAGESKTEYGQILKQKIKEYKLKERVFLTGKITDSDKIYYYQNCLAFVFPSLREGFGLPVIEAMTFGKPVFLSTKTSLPEIGGDISFYWENFDASYMAQVFEGGMSRFERNKNAYVTAYKKHSKEFTWENAAKKYIEVYKSILRNSG